MKATWRGRPHPRESCPHVGSTPGPGMAAGVLRSAPLRWMGGRLQSGVRSPETGGGTERTAKGHESSAGGSGSLVSIRVHSWFRVLRRRGGCWGMPGSRGWRPLANIWRPPGEAGGAGCGARGLVACAGGRCPPMRYLSRTRATAALPASSHPSRPSRRLAQHDTARISSCNSSPEFATRFQYVPPSGECQIRIRPHGV